MSVVAQSPARILIVDDEVAMCTLCARVLRSAGYTVTEATDVATALARLQDTQPFDLLLADIQLPGMSGMTLAQRALELDPEIAVVIMTGYASVENLRQSVRHGATDFLPKPFDLAELRNAVEEALRKRRQLQESIRLRALEQVLASSEAIGAILQRDQLADVILSRAQHLVKANAVFLRLHDRPDLSTVLAHPPTWELSAAGIDLAEQAQVATRILMSDGAAAVAASAEERVNYGMALPLRARGEPVGVLIICTEHAETLRPSARDMLSLLANQAASALHNAALYGQLQDAYRSLQELDRLKSEFIAIASHELRTPLSIVLGYTMMMRDQSENEHRDYAQRILDGAQQIKEIVDDMISLRHLEVREAVVTPEQCQLSEIFAQVVARFGGQAQDHRQQLRVESDPLPEFLADREKLLLILGGLVSNALKFTPDGGSVTLGGGLWERERLSVALHNAITNTTFRHATAEGAKTWVVIQIADTGIGIRRREHARIFDRFYQVADSLTREHGGAGLGLALVRDLIDIHGGVVWVESAEGQGSRFFCALPYQPAPEIHRAR